MIKKTLSKKDGCCGSKQSQKKSQTINEIHKVGGEIKDMLDKAKMKYEKADDGTKKALIAGVAGAAAIIAGAIGYKKMKSKK
jgi:hypothetical protein